MLDEVAPLPSTVLLSADRERRHAHHPLLGDVVDNFWGLSTELIQDPWWSPSQRRRSPEAIPKLPGGRRSRTDAVMRYLTVRRDPAQKISATVPAFGGARLADWAEHSGTLCRARCRVDLDLAGAAERRERSARAGRSRRQTCRAVCRCSVMWLPSHQNGASRGWSGHRRFLGGGRGRRAISVRCRGPVPRNWPSRSDVWSIISAAA